MRGAHTKTSARRQTAEVFKHNPIRYSILKTPHHLHIRFHPAPPAWAHNRVNWLQLVQKPQLACGYPLPRTCSCEHYTTHTHVLSNIYLCSFDSYRQNPGERCSGSDRKKPLQAAEALHLAIRVRCAFIDHFRAIMHISIGIMAYRFGDNTQELLSLQGYLNGSLLFLGLDRGIPLV